MSDATRDEFLEAREIAVRLRAIATPGSEAGQIVTQISDALGVTPPTDMSVGAMRDGVRRARELLGE